MGSFEEFALDHSRDAMMLLENSRVTFLNKSLEDLIGTSRQDLVGTGPDKWAFLVEEGREACSEILDRNLNDESSCTKEVVRNTGAKNERMQIHFNKYRSSQVCCIFRTILQETQSLTEAQEQIKLLQALLNLTPIRLGVVDELEGFSNFRIIVCNTAFAESLKATPELITGKTTEEIGIPRKLRKKWGENFRLANGKDGPVSLEFEVISPFENHIPEWVACRMLHYNNNRFLFVRTNITTRVLLEHELKNSKNELEVAVQKLERALQVKSAFLANMSHEIRTPLNGVVSVLSLLNVPEDQEELVKMGTVCGEQLTVVINDILDLTKLEENKVFLESKSFCLRNAILDSFDIILLCAIKKGLELIVDVDTEIQDEVIGDPTRLRQIVINLLSNAVKFSQKGDIVVKVSMTQLPKPSPNDIMIQVSVSDQGIGIPQKDQYKLFQPFTQADTTVNRRYGGSGLGLTICQKLAGLMNGKIWFESTEGKGSTFHFTACLQKSDKKFCNLAPAAQFVGKRLLVVDQSLACLSALKKKLTSWGFVVDTVQSFENYDNSQVNAMLVDARLARSVPQSNCVPIIWMTYDRTLDNALRKPISELALMDHLENLFCDHPTARATIPKQLSASLTPIEGFEKMNVLLAEDNAMNQKILGKLLEKLGCTNLKIVENGKEAVEAFMMKFYDIVLMDLMMPEMDGIEATECILKIPYQKPPFIIALTADALCDTKELCLKKGMKEVITKPVDVNKLKQVFLEYQASLEKNLN